MRILIDAAPIANRSGTGYYVQKLLEALSHTPTPHDFVALVPPLAEGETDAADWPGGRGVQVEHAAPGAPWRQVLWRQWRLATLAKRYAADLVHYPAFIGSLRCGVPSVVTIPDLVWRLHTESISPRKRRYYERVIPASMARARRLIAISLATTKAIAETFPAYAEKTRTVLLGVDRAVFAPEGAPGQAEAVRARYGLPPRFVLALGTLEPRKNLPALVSAFERVAPELPDVHLVLAGKAGYLSQALRDRGVRSAVAARLVFAGHIAPADLPAVYRLADVFAFPSLNEGFGLPILEAMACGVPVVTSDRSATAEVAGDAAVLVDPESVPSIAAGLRRVLTDAEHRDALRRAGLARADAFPWSRTAEQTVAVYEEAVA